MKKAFQTSNFRASTLELIDKCNVILERYSEAGYDMTLRQLYYQLVSADEIPNNQKEYDKLGATVNNARLGGLIDWDLLVDRTRSLKGLGHWESPAGILDSVCWSYRIDKWKDQPYRPEVWIEKDALAGVFERVCRELDVPYFSCRGYTSQSEMYSAAQRMRQWSRADQKPIVLHFGDHDPSGIDMSRDIQERLEMFGVSLEFNRLALNMDQVEEYDPPPNPAKITDSRAIGYIEKFGDSSWELDALEPDVLAGLVRDAITEFQDEDLWTAAVERESGERRALRQVRDNFGDIQQYIADQIEDGNFTDDEDDDDID